MSEEEKTLAEFKKFSPDEVALLREFLKNLETGQQLMVWIARIGAIAAGTLGAIYYAVAICRSQGVKN